MSKREELKVRFANASDDSEQIIDWLNRHSATNKYNPDILNSKSLRVLVHYNSEGIQMYSLVQTVLMLESVAPRPGIDPLTSAQCFRDLTKASWLLASGQNISSVYALDCGGGLDRLATNNQYELVGEKQEDQLIPFKVYRSTL